MTCSATHPVPGRAKRSEQTIYDAATREVLQIDFRYARKRFWLRECNYPSLRFKIQRQMEAERGGLSKTCVRARELFAAEEL
jgi:hypothetical protein